MTVAGTLGVVIGLVIAIALGRWAFRRPISLVYKEVEESTEVDSLTTDMNPPQLQAFDFRAQEVQENREDVKARGWSPTKKIHIAFFLSLPGVVFGLCAWIAFILAIVAMRKLEPSEKTSPTTGLLIVALVLGGLFGPVKSFGNLLVRLGVV